MRDVVLAVGVSIMAGNLPGNIGRRLWEIETADFRANRLLTAARRDPDLMFFFLAELAREQDDQSFYFASKLT